MAVKPERGVMMWQAWLRGGSNAEDSDADVDDSMRLAGTASVWRRISGRQCIVVIGRPTDQGTTQPADPGTTELQPSTDLRHLAQRAEGSHCTPRRTLQPLAGRNWQVPATSAHLLLFSVCPQVARASAVVLATSDGVLEDMSLASRILEDNFYSPWPWPWPRGYVLGLGLVDKVLEFTKDTYTSSADALNVPT